MSPPGCRDVETLRRAAPRAATLWGDGFADDKVFDMWAVRDWALCSPDEYIMLFPRLIPQGGEVSPVLRAHLESCVAARAWRLAKLDGRGATGALRSHLPHPDAGVRHHRDWFSDDDTVTRLLRSVGRLRTPIDRIEAERTLLTFLDSVLFEIQGERVPSWSDSSEASLAFGAGIHPAYVWPRATASPERGIAAGWLGHLDRGRTALMPLPVADYLLDVFGRGEACSDRQMAGLAGSEAAVAILLRAARRRSAGHDPSIRLSPDAVPLANFFTGPSRRSRALETDA